MGENLEMTREKYFQHISERNVYLREKIGSIFVQQAEEMLIVPPFDFPDYVCENVANGIVYRGDKLEPEEDLPKNEVEAIVNLNKVGKEFRKMLYMTILVLDIGNQEFDNEEQRSLFHKLYPTPSRKGCIYHTKLGNSITALLEIEKFLKNEASQGRSTAIVFLGNNQSNSVTFEDKCVSISQIEGHVLNVVKEALLPAVVDLITVDKCHLHVSTICNKADECIEHCTVFDV